MCYEYDGNSTRNKRLETMNVVIDWLAYTALGFVCGLLVGEALLRVQ